MHTLLPLKSGKVPFVGVADMTRLMAAIGVEHGISILTEYIKADFLRWASFKKSLRYAAHSPDGVIELMPTSDDRQFAFKYVNGHPINTKSDLQTITAFGVLSDVDSGYPVLLSEMTLLTAMRTAAMSALAAKFLAPSNTRSMTLIGCGAQSEFQALGFKALLGIDTVRLYDVDDRAIEKCARNLANSGLEVVACLSAAQAVNGSEIITVCTADKQSATVLTKDMVRPGTHVNAVGGDCPGKTELEASILHDADIFVEYAPQTRIEGEIQQLPETHPVTELWEVFAGCKRGRIDQEDVTIFDSVGFAIEDFSALRFLYQQLIDYPYYEELDLVASPTDPRNLFGLLPKHTAEATLRRLA